MLPFHDGAQLGRRKAFDVRKTLEVHPDWLNRERAHEARSVTLRI